jgi:hypothetical protein
MEKKKKACSKLVEDQIIKAYKFLDEKWLLGRRRRRHPSLDAFADLAGSTEARRRADSPFVPHVAGRRPVTRSSHVATSSSMEAHV